jgi:hypothetical protein
MKETEGIERGYNTWMIEQKSVGVIMTHTVKMKVYKAATRLLLLLGDGELR